MNCIGFRFALLGAVLLAAGLTAQAEAAPAVHVVTIENMQYTPATLELAPGDIVEWDNRGVVPHTATARAGSFDVEVAPGAKARVVVDAGTIEVYCRFHPTMQATLVVK